MTARTSASISTLETLEVLTPSSSLTLSRALAKAAFAKRMRACYVRQPELEDPWRGSRTRQGGKRKLLGKFGGDDSKDWGKKR